MSQNITWDDFSSGWVPSDNDSNGRKNGLIQLDNCELDENGALVLSGGTQVLYSGFPSNANVMYSRFIGGSRQDYHNDNNGSVYRNSTFLTSGGNPIIAGFGTAFDFVLYTSGTVRKKDKGFGTPVNLGISPATATPGITISAASDPFAVIGPITSQFAVSEGTGFIVIGNTMQLTANDEGIAVIQSFQVPGAPINCNNLQGIGGFANIGAATGNDYIVLAGYLTDPFKKSLQFDVILVPGDASGAMVSDYYTYVVNDLSKEATYNTDGSFSIRMKRSDFVRNGAGQQSWSTSYGYRITFKGTPQEKINLLGNANNDPTIRIVGGDKTQNGQYQYMQINVNNTGSYIAKSPIGQISQAVDIDMGQALITPLNPIIYDPQCNEAWIFRRIGGSFYRIKVFVGDYSTQYDTMSDEAALKLNIKWNENLRSASSTASGIPDNIMNIVGPIEGRWFYFTNNLMYPSEINNPDLVDPTIAVRLTGTNTEKFLWAFKVGERTVIVGTSVDIYLLTGTFITQPDFTVDIYYDAVGCEYPPITYNATENSNGVFYLAKDGWRVVTPNGQSTNLVAPNTDRLYDNQTCYGYPPANLNFNPGDVRFPIVLAKNKMWCFITGSDRVEVFDFARKYWRVVKFDTLGSITAATSTQDGKVLAYFSSNIIREIDINSNKLIDSTSLQSIKIKTLIFDNNTPSQRKDSMSFKIQAYTGGNILNIVVVNDNNIESVIGSISSFNPTGTEFNLDLSTTNAALTRTYQIYITGFVSDFRLINAQIWFETRPVPVSFLRIQSLNYGVAGRKRIFSIPFVIDTRGSSVDFQPVVDNINHVPMNVNNNYKQTLNYKSLINGIETDMIGRDFEYIIHSTNGIFEFFEIPPPRVIETLPDPIRSFIVPNSNFGTTSRKRLRLMRFVIDTRGGIVTFTPIINGIVQPSSNHQTFNGKTTVFHYFTSDQIGIDFGGKFESNTEFELYEALPPQQDDIEIFPDSTKIYVMPITNFGTTARKRLRNRRFVLDTKGFDVVFIPIIDGTNQAPQTYNYPIKKTFYYFYTSDQIGVDFGGLFSASQPFELWQILPPENGDVEIFPDPVRYFVMPVTNYGTTARKRVRLRKFIIDPKDAIVTFTPIIDGVNQTSQNYAGGGKRTCYYYYTSDMIGVDYSGVFSGTSDFELWAILDPEPDDVEKFPDPCRYLVFPVTNYGTTGRKRLRVIRFILDPRNAIVTFTPIIDGVEQVPSQTYSGSGKRTCYYYYTSDHVGVDFSGVLNGTSEFELWQILAPEDADVEIMPDAVEYMIIPPNNYGTNNVKHLRSMSFILNTYSYNVRFSPIVDGIQIPSTSIFNTNGKTTVTHYFTDDITGVDFGGILESIADPKQPFEVWQIMNPGDGDVTVIVASAKFYSIQETNFGSPNKKRIRVWPFIIDTHGHDVIFTPKVDCQVVGSVSVFNSPCKKTVWHFFKSDVFGVDYGGDFQTASDNIFDLYEIMAPDIVQVLPIARRFDQLGPAELFKYGKIKQLELRVLPFNVGAQSNIPFIIYFNDNTNYTANFVVDNNKEASYFVGVPKGTAGNIVRIELGPTIFDFHRFYIRLQVNRSGMNTEMEWVSLETGNQA